MTRARFQRWLKRRTACWLRRCDYYTHYLAYGAPDLTHAGYHARERRAVEHFDRCRYAVEAVYVAGKLKISTCPTCRSHEEALRV